MTTCDERHEQLVDLVFGELDETAAIHLHRHLAECVSCRAEERRLVELRDAARESVAGPSPLLRARIEAALPPHSGARHLGALTRPVPAYVAVATALAAALITAAGFALAPRWETSARVTPSAPPAPPPDARPVVTAAASGIPFSSAISYVTRVAVAPPRTPGQDSL